MLSILWAENKVTATKMAEGVILRYDSYTNGYYNTRILSFTTSEVL